MADKLIPASAVADPVEIFDAKGKRAELLLQVPPGITVYLAEDVQTLKTPNPDGTQGGIAFTSADGIVRVPITGKMYGIANTQAAYLKMWRIV